MTWTILSTITYYIWQGLPHILYLLETVIVQFYIFRNSTTCVINSLVSFPKTSKVVQLTIFMKLKKTFHTFLFPIWEMLYWQFERFLPKNALSWLILKLDFFDEPEFCQKFISTIITVLVQHHARSGIKDINIPTSWSVTSEPCVPPTPKLNPIPWGGGPEDLSLLHQLQKKINQEAKSNLSWAAYFLALQYFFSKCLSITCFSI